jgi:CRISPR system Cascade subunit CasC
MGNYLCLDKIQNFPVSCLCRDETNSPKTVVFGGTTRTRVSKASISRAMRDFCKEKDKTHFGGVRTRYVAKMLSESFSEKGIDQDLATALSGSIADFLATSKDEKTKTILFISPGEIDAITSDIVQAKKEKKLEKFFDIAKDKDDSKKLIYSVKKKGLFLKDKTISDIADIEIFGRMVASDPTLKVDGASYCIHPFLSTPVRTRSISLQQLMRSRARKIPERQ